MKLDALVAPLSFVELDESRAIRGGGHEERVVAELIRLSSPMDDHPIGRNRHRRQSRVAVCRRRLTPSSRAALFAARGTLSTRPAQRGWRTGLEPATTG